MTGLYSHPLRRKSIISAKQFGDRQMLLDFFERADELDQMENAPQLLKGKRGKIWFYEASTRTRDMAETSLRRFGCDTHGPSDASRVSSFVKTGESIEDTMHIIAQRAHLIVLRHPADDAGRRAEAVLRAYDVIVLDGGSGAYEHPFQALKDMRAYWKRFGRIDDLSICYLGDLRNARTVRSNIWLACMVCKNFKPVFVSQPELRISPDVREYLDEHNISYWEHDWLEDTIGEVDGYYGLRLQRERFKDEEEDLYLRLARTYPLITPDFVRRIPLRNGLFHPMPRGPEMSPELDPFPQQFYIPQAQGGYGMFEAVLEAIFG